MSEIDPKLIGVCYREGPITRADYDEAIQSLIDARDLTDSLGCPVCHDAHSAAQCHHNPLVLARQWAAATNVCVCFHCGFVATNDQEALAHFGPPVRQDKAICQSGPESQLVKDLAMVVVRVCRRLSRFDPDLKTHKQAMDFLKRKRLLGSPLRTERVTEKAS